MIVITGQQAQAEASARGTTVRAARCGTTHRCRCGQELDGSRRGHCPRCGTTLRDS